RGTDGRLLFFLTGTVGAATMVAILTYLFVRFHQPAGVSVKQMQAGFWLLCTDPIVLRCNHKGYIAHQVAIGSGYRDFATRRPGGHTSRDQCLGKNLETRGSSVERDAGSCA